MDQFDFKFYYNFYPDLQKKNINTPNKLLEHYKLHGKNENRVKNKLELLDIYKFNPYIYRYNYEDLQHMNDEELKSHYVNYGHYEKRNCSKKIVNEIEIKYQIIKKNNNPIFKNNQLLAHLHCYDIDKFNEYFGKYIKNIINYFNVYVTFSIGETIPDYDIEILKINNKGMDIGGKICFLAYLENNKICYSHILFLHSKNDIKKREIYFKPYISNIEQINYICSIIGNYDLIYNNLILDGDWNKKIGYTINKYYYDEYLKLMNYKNLTTKFIEGNCLIVSKKMVQSMFPKKYLIFFYNKLNNKNTFDINWVKHQYKLFNYNEKEIYKIYKKKKYYGNHLNHTNQKLISDYTFIFNDKSVDIENYFLKDGAYEHLWERLWLNVCLNINGKYKIIDNVYHKIKLKYNFDTNLYKFINNISSKNDIESIYNLQNNISENEIYSLKQILKILPLNFNIDQFCSENNINNMNNNEIINYYCKKKKKNNNEKKWIDTIECFNNLKIFTHIFPQFHEIEENNKFWGEGFTEWWNVRKTFQIHNKHLPLHPDSDIGYYNLLDFHNRKRWDLYAEDNGIYGFVFCHYWFSKGIVMNKVIDKMLEDGMPNKPWFFNWINENWTKRWDGGNNEILLDVCLDIKKCEEHFKCILKYFKSKNYYKINNKPVLAIYRPCEIPKLYIQKFKELACKNNFSGLIFIKTLNNNLENNFTINSDNYCEYEFEYPPNYSGTLVDSKINNNNFEFYKKMPDTNKCNNYDINEHFIALTNTKSNKKKLIRGIMPCWDNLPRHTTLKSDCHIQIGSNSFIFYLTLLKQFKKLKEEGGEYMIINSLNEWAEQCILEPSIQNKYSYLEALKLAKKTNLELIDSKLLNCLINF